MHQTKRSVTNTLWRFKEPDPLLVMTLMQRFEIEELTARVIGCLDVPIDEVDHFLNPTIRYFLPEPYDLLDMEKAVKATCEAIQKGLKIVVYGDYDVDGATSSALIRRYMAALQIPCGVYIPDRIEEGYGANADALLALKGEGVDLVIMVDCGTTAFEPLEIAFQENLSVIVLDHHTAETKLPHACAIVNPNRLDQPELVRPEMRHLCAAGVTYLFIVALNRALRHMGFFTEKGIAEPDLRQYLDLVALGTVCDVMPLVGLNRAFVKQGLKVLSRRMNIGLSHLSDIAKVNEKPSVYHLGFLIGPRINAGGRVGESVLGSHLLTSDDWLWTKEIALKLHAYNQERQEIEKVVLKKALEEIEEKRLDERPVLLLGHDQWHPGVIGIVASRLKERFAKPVCVVGFSDEIGKGSGRSVTGVHLGNAMIKATHLGLLEKGGGHAMAAGFTVLKSNFDQFYDFLCMELEEKVRLYTPSLDIIGCLSLSALKSTLIDRLEQLEPFGIGNPNPKFLLKNIRIHFMEDIGDGSHKRCQIVDEHGNYVKMMAFRVSGTPLENALRRGRNEPFDAVVSLKKDTFNAKQNLQFILEDMAF